MVEAAVYGSVAASFALEQIGLPALGVPEGSDTERCNGVEFEARLRAYRKRV